MISNDFSNQVRLHVLTAARESGQVPDAVSVAQALGRAPADVIDAFRQLDEAHVFVVEPRDPSRLRMANPFSAIPTQFSVEVRRRGYFGNCIWDGLGIISLLGGDGRLETTCPDCGEGLQLEVADRRLARAEGIVHFGVPARHWWDDIVHT